MTFVQRARDSIDTLREIVDYIKKNEKKLVRVVLKWEMEVRSAPEQPTLFFNVIVIVIKPCENSQGLFLCFSSSVLVSSTPVKCKKPRTFSQDKSLGKFNYKLCFARNSAIASPPWITLTPSLFSVAGAELLAKTDSNSPNALPNLSTISTLFGSFPISQFFASGGQTIGVSASASVLPMNT